MSEEYGMRILTVLPLLNCGTAFLVNLAVDVHVFKFNLELLILTSMLSIY